MEPARASYFASHRIYPLSAADQALAEKYKPRLVLHPQGLAPIDFDDYLVDAELMSLVDKQQAHPQLRDAAKSNFSRQCTQYVKPARQEVSSRPPYPWYVQVFRDKAPGKTTEEWTYLKYNLIFDWSGLALDMGWMARTGVFLLGASPTKWHRLDVHTTVVIGVDGRGYQRLVTINQHNYVRTYLGGTDFDMGQPVVIVAALRSNELYLDEGWTEAQRFPVVRFYDSVPYLISGENKPFFVAMDLVLGAQAGGLEVPTRLRIIAPADLLAAFAGLLAPPQRLWGRIYTGRDGPMGYDYYSLPRAVPLNRLASLGYWRGGDKALVQGLGILMEEQDSFDDDEGWDAIIDLLESHLQPALQRQLVN